MLSFTLPDDLALGWFIASWIVYSLVIEKSGKGRSGLNALMNGVREDWMGQMIAREVRIVDSQVTAALQNGTAFFASTSLIAIGGTLSLLRTSEQIMTVIAALPLSVPTTPAMWELKVVGLAVIFVYAFFKFAWSYRLFNYLAIMIGAAPPTSDKDTPAARAFVHRASRLCADAGLHFNRGQRAFFFALGYLGWFLGPAELAVSTTAVLIVMWRRQFNSTSRNAFDTPLAELDRVAGP
jgi:uncharacterized membrane protein